MNLDKLKQAEHDFLRCYPGGFDHPELQKVGKKHKLTQMVEKAQAELKPSKFRHTRAMADTLVQLVSRSSMVSLFEKPKFRDFVTTLDEADAKRLTHGLKLFLHGDQEKGFHLMLNVLAAGKLAKWSLITIIPNYYAPHDEVFVKPTTAKGIIKLCELHDLSYHPKPSYAFYQGYRAAILEMKRHVDASLTTSNAAFCGFLMMSFQP